MVRLFGKLYLPFLDPVFLKDLEGLSRRWRMYASRMIYIALIGGLVFFVLGTLKGPIRPSRAAALGRGLFSGLVALQLVYVTVAMAHLAADLLLREARSGTLQLMLLTPLSGWRIALGKWKAVMAHSATLILSGLPALGITAYLGGVGPWDLLWSSSLSLALAGVSSALALFAALKSRTAVRSAAVAVSLVVASGLLLLLVFGIAYVVSRSPWVTFFAGCLHPVAAAIAAANAGSIGTPAGYGWIGSTVLSLIVAQVFLMSAAGHLSISSTLDELLSQNDPETKEEAFVRAMARSRSVWESHPLLWREFSMRGGDQVRRVFAVVAVPLLVYLFTPRMGGPSMVEVWLAVITGFAMAAGSGLFILDKEGRHLEVLMTLPVTSAQVIGAKLLSRLCTVECLAFLISSFFLLDRWRVDPDRTRVPLTLLLACFTLFAYVLSALASLYVRTARAAFVLAAMLVWGALFGFPLLRPVVGRTFLEIAHPTVLAEGLLGSQENGIFLGTFVGIYGGLVALMIALMIRQYREQVR